MSNQRGDHTQPQGTGELKKIALLFVLAITIGLFGFFGNQIRTERNRESAKGGPAGQQETLGLKVESTGGDRVTKESETHRAFSFENNGGDVILPDSGRPEVNAPQTDRTFSWQTIFDGYGNVEIGDVISLAPKMSTAPGETHAALVMTERDHPNPTTIKLKMRTTRQLRTGSPPNPWEVAWIFFNYQDLKNYHYFILKPNGVELGKKQGTLDQTFLQTANDPRLSLGTWYNLKIVLTGPRIQISINNSPAIDFVDPSPLPLGRLGLYTEDARVEFKEIEIASRSETPY